jgi:hypothetical protein
MNLGFEDNVPDEDRYTDFTTNETSAESYSDIYESIRLGFCEIVSLAMIEY